MAYLTSTHKEMRNFIIGKTIKDFRSEDGMEILEFTDGTRVRFTPRVRITQSPSGVNWEAEILANPIQKDNKMGWDSF